MLSSNPDKCNAHVEFSELITAYEDVSSLLATWYSDPDFCDSAGKPQVLSIRRGKKSLKALWARTGVEIEFESALNFLRRSSSIEIKGNLEIRARRQVLVLPNFALFRAALVIPRYLDTLRSNHGKRTNSTIRLLERQSSVPGVSDEEIAPILSAIRTEGESYLNSIDSMIEGARTKNKNAGERTQLGILTFAWTMKAKDRLTRKHKC